MVAWTWTEFAVYEVEDSPDKEAKVMADVMENILDHDFSFLISNENRYVLLHQDFVFSQFLQNKCMMFTQPLDKIGCTSA